MIANNCQEDGWTLAELLIVVAIIAVLAVMFLLVNWKRNIFRAHDAQRKTDVANVRRAFEEYYNDNNCYPALTILNTCEGAALSPYLAKIPCDPTTEEPYKYQPDSDTNTCAGNRICTKLQDWADPDITTLGCHPQNGCGWGAYWNYCLATGTTVTAAGFDPGVSPTPTPTPTPSYGGNAACTPGGLCDNYDNPALHGCPISWDTVCPPGACNNPANRCIN